MARSHLIIATLMLLAAIAIFALYDKTKTTESRPAADIVPENAFVVTLTPDGYEPSEFTIPVGTPVTFRSTTGKPHWPASNLHPTHEIYSAFDPLMPVDADESWTFVFDQVGSWNFHDHMRAYYTGTVHVTPLQ